MKTSYVAQLTLAVTLAFATACVPEAACAASPEAIHLGPDAPPPSIEAEVAAANRIGRFHIISTRPSYTHAKNTNSDCGYVYEASTVEGLKGGNAPIKFYSIEGGLRVNSDYLLFIHKVRRGARDLISEFDGLVTIREGIAISCRIWSSDFYLPVDRQTYFSFDSDAAMLFGGEWLDGYEKGLQAGFSWCQRGVIPYGRKAAYKLFRTREKVKGDPSSLVFDWSSAKMLVKRALGNSPYSSDGTLRSNFLPGEC